MCVVGEKGADHAVFGGVVIAAVVAAEDHGEGAV